MSLPITFHRAASAEFIEASAWYEGKRLGLALEFMAEIDRCVSLASEHPSPVYRCSRGHSACRCPSFPIQCLFSRGERSHRCLGGFSRQQRPRHLAGQNLTLRSQAGPRKSAQPLSSTLKGFDIDSTLATNLCLITVFSTAATITAARPAAQSIPPPAIAGAPTGSAPGYPPM